MILAIVALSGPAFGASLDNIEVGGVWGGPLAENPTAIWWNPAGLARTPGTQVFVEGAPTFGAVHFTRNDPYNGGSDTYRLQGVLPFAGVSSDFGVPGLGAGLALEVPFVRGGAADGQPGPGSFAFRTGSIRALYGTAAVGYAPKGSPIAIGGSFSFVRSEWKANLDSELTTSLDAQITAMHQQSGYTDAQIEDQDYATNLDFGLLHDETYTFGFGIRGDFDPIKVSVAYSHGESVNNQGPVTLHFHCPPQSDTIGRFGAEAFGLCNTDLNANAAVAYSLPSRIHGAIAYTLDDKLTAQFMGGYVLWHAYKDFDITIRDVENLNDLSNPNTATLVNQHRLWARDNVDSYWLAGDVKGRIGDKVIVGGRLLFDRYAVPDALLSPNNVDNSLVEVTPMGTYQATPWLRLGVTYGHSFFFQRVVTNSAFKVTLADDRPEDRFFYPQMNGNYGGGIDRFGIVVDGRFGVKPDDEKRAPL